MNKRITRLRKWWCENVHNDVHYAGGAYWTCWRCFRTWLVPHAMPKGTGDLVYEETGNSAFESGRKPGKYTFIPASERVHDSHARRSGAVNARSDWNDRADQGAANFGEGAGPGNSKGV
jgi:hypothetical protein